MPSIQEIIPESLPTPEAKQIADALTPKEETVYPETLVAANQTYGKGSETLDGPLANRNLQSLSFVAGAGISISVTNGIVTITNTEPVLIDDFLLMGA